MKHKILLTSLVAMFAVGSAFADDPYITDGSTCNDTTLGASVLTDGSADLVADWSKNTYHVVYNNMTGATNPASNLTSYDIDDTPLVLSNPTKTGYDFGGWYDNAGLTGTAITQLGIPSPDQDGTTTQLYAQWTAHTYNITYTCDGTPVTGTYTATYDAATPAASILHASTACSTYVSGDFTCSTTLPAAGDTWTIANDVTCTYSSAGQTVQVSWDPDNGGATTNNTCTYGGTDVDAPAAPTKPGYTFLGWKKKPAANNP